MTSSFQPDLFGNEPPPRTDRDRYEEYLRSPQWRRKRSYALEKAGYCCQRCGASRWMGKLDVHHLTYDHFGAEPLDDLIVLCRKCHETADVERKLHIIDKIRKAEEAHAYARIDGWATKVYGEGWQESTDYEEVAERFYEWLERRGE